MFTFIDLSISAPFHFSLCITSHHLSMFWGRMERGFTLVRDERAQKQKGLVATWREAGSLNVAALGLHLMAC